MTVDLLEHFPAGATPRPEQARLLAGLADALAEIADDPRAPRVLLVEAPPGIGKSHLAMTLARWSGDAYLLTSQKHLQDQYEREFGGELALVKGRDNYLCERYPGAAVPTSRGLCRRARGPACGCPYVRAKQAAINAPIFCTNTAYFATLRHWHAEHLRRRRLLIVDEAHNLENQLVSVFTARFSHDEMRAWFGRPLPRLALADEYRPVLAEHVERLETRRQEIVHALDGVHPPELPDDVVLAAPPTREEQDLLEQREQLDAALARLTFFLEAEDREWIVRYPEAPAAALSLVPLTVAAMARALLADCAEVTVLSSAYLGHRDVLAECFELEPSDVRVFTIGSPFRSSSGRSSTGRSGRCRAPPPRAWSRRSSPRWRRSWPRTRIRRGSSMWRPTRWGVAWFTTSRCARRASRGACCGSIRRGASCRRSTTIAPRPCRRCSSRRRSAKGSTCPTTSCASRSSPSCPTPISATPGPPPAAPAISAGTPSRRPRRCCRPTVAPAATPTITA